jgi:hypothetical protein
LKFLSLTFYSFLFDTFQAIFSSAIVFDTPKWELEGESNENSTDELNAEAKSSTKLAHYGGSERTVDAVARGQKKRASISTDEALVHERVLIITHQNTGSTSGKMSIFGFPGLYDTSLSSSMPKVAAAASTDNPRNASEATCKQQTIDLATSDDDDKQDSDSDASFGSALEKTGTLSVTKTRHAPKRQASLKRKRYTADDDKDEHNTSSDESEVQKDLPPSKRSKSVKAKKEAAVNKTAKPAQKRRLRLTPAAGKSKNDALDLLESIGHDDMNSAGITEAVNEEVGKNEDMVAHLKVLARRREADNPVSRAKFKRISTFKNNNTASNGISGKPLPTHDPQSQSPVSSGKSPFRRRRKKQSPGNGLGSPATAVLDLTVDDDEFTFR